MRIGIQIDFAGGYGRGVLRGLLSFASLRSDWEFVMPPMYALGRAKQLNLKGLSGVIAMVHSPRSVAPYRKTRVPVVNVARTLSAKAMEEHKLVSVLPDDAAVGRLAFDYFHQRGFRSFAFCGHPTAEWSLLRGQAIADRCQEQGLFFSNAGAADQVNKAWLRSLPRPCALLAANDRYAWHAIDACREAKIAVPEELAVLGVDNDTLFTELMKPTLSSIDINAERIGFHSATVLSELIDAKSKATRTSFAPIELPPAGVVSRNSTDVLSIHDDVVAESVRFIRDNAATAINVGDVLKHVASSRRNLERRFRRAMGRSLHDELQRVRLDRACKLLRETDLDMLSVSRQCGFSNQFRFSTVFKNQLISTPTDYRKLNRVGLR